jgi:hypothetical protein
MPIELGQMRDLLMPGILQLSGSYKALPEVWETIFELEAEPTVSAPHIWIPKLTIQQTVAVGAAAMIVKNPVVTRRFWAGWFSSEDRVLKSCP